MVNFIGVPIAAWQSYEAWLISGIPPDQLTMDVLSSKVETPNVILFLAGAIMVITLWFSSRAKNVLKTSIDLSDQSEIKERFKANLLAKYLVKFIAKKPQDFILSNGKSFTAKQMMSYAFDYFNLNYNL